MGANDGGIDDQVFEVGIIGHRLENAIPNTLETPSAEASEYAVPLPEPPGDHATESRSARSAKVRALLPCCIRPVYRHPLIAGRGPSKK